MHNNLLLYGYLPVWIIYLENFESLKITANKLNLKQNSIASITTLMPLQTKTQISPRKDHEFEKKWPRKKDIVLGDKMLLKKRARVKWQSNKSPENR